MDTRKGAIGFYISLLKEQGVTEEEVIERFEKDFGELKDLEREEMELAFKQCQLEYKKMKQKA